MWWHDKKSPNELKENITDQDLRRSMTVNTCWQGTWWWSVMTAVWQTALLLLIFTAISSLPLTYILSSFCKTLPYTFNPYSTNTSFTVVIGGDTVWFGSQWSADDMPASGWWTLADQDHIPPFHQHPQSDTMLCLNVFHKCSYTEEKEEGWNHYYIQTMKVTWKNETNARDTIFSHISN